MTNVMYCMLLLTGTIAALILRYTGQDLSVCVYNCGSEPADAPWMPVNSTSYSMCEGGKCQGQWAVYRISFSLFSLFVVMLLVSSCKSRFSVFAHRGFWFAKILSTILVLVGCLVRTDHTTRLKRKHTRL